MTDTIRVLVVDDHAIVRSGLRLFILGFRDIELAGEAFSGESALAQCDKLLPDVVLMDIMMPGMGGVEATRRIRQAHPEMQVLALSSFERGDIVQEALQAGAIGYLLKDASGPDLAQAIRRAAQGQRSLAPAAAGALIEETTRPAPVDYQLTERQVEVLALMVAGKSNAEIARDLFVTLATARFHVSTILSKMNAANRAEAAALAVKHDLV